MKKLTLSIACLMFPIVTHATPVELICTMTNGTKDVEWNISLDEATGSVSYSIPEMQVNRKYPGIFTTDKVVFENMEISRVDLTFKRTTNLLGDITIDNGLCQIAKIPKRKF